MSRDLWWGRSPRGNAHDHASVSGPSALSIPNAYTPLALPAALPRGGMLPLMTTSLSVGRYEWKNTGVGN